MSGSSGSGGNTELIACHSFICRIPRSQKGCVPFVLRSFFVFRPERSSMIKPYHMVFWPGRCQCSAATDVCCQVRSNTYNSPLQFMCFFPGQKLSLAFPTDALHLRTRVHIPSKTRHTCRSVSAKRVEQKSACHLISERYFLLDIIVTCLTGAFHRCSSLSSHRTAVSLLGAAAVVAFCASAFARLPRLTWEPGLRSWQDRLETQWVMFARLFG